MWRKRNQQPDELQDVARRLGDERPTVDPLRLDQIKTTAMARAGAGRRAGFTGRRAVAGALTVGLMAAGTGGVLAQGGTTFNAAQAQYAGRTCATGQTLNSSGVCVTPSSGTGANNSHTVTHKKKKAKKKVKAKHQRLVIPRFTG